MAFKPKLVSQERMPESVVPLAEKRGNGTWEEVFDDPHIPYDKKLHLVMQFCDFETLNGVTKKDLQTILRWVVNENYDRVQV